MTERDYILLSDLRAVLHAEKLLGDIVPANSEVVSAVDFRRVMRQLDDWRVALFAAVEQRRADDDE